MEALKKKCSAGDVCQWVMASTCISRRGSNKLVDVEEKQGPISRSSRPHPLLPSVASRHEAIVHDLVTYIIGRVSPIPSIFVFTLVVRAHNKYFDISVAGSKNNQASRCGGQG
jgi:hypothetical protein